MYQPSYLSGQAFPAPAGPPACPAAGGRPAETARQSLAAALSSPDEAIREIHGVLSAAVPSPGCA